LDSSFFHQQGGEIEGFKLSRRKMKMMKKRRNFKKRTRTKMSRCGALPNAMVSWSVKKWAMKQTGKIWEDYDFPKHWILGYILSFW
jgi:hypothetical protein